LIRRDLPKIYNKFASGPYVIQARIIHSEAGRVLSPGWLLVKDGRVVDFGHGSAPEIADAQKVDLPDLALFPGTIDAHAHLDLDEGFGLDLFERVERAVSYGVAAIRDGGDRLCRVLSERGRIEKDLRLAVSGTALFQEGRYGSFLGRAMKDLDDIKKSIRDLADSGVDQIKVLASGLVNLETFGRVGKPQFTEDELKKIVRLANDVGLEVMAHANGPDAAAWALNAGVGSVEHGYFMGAENIHRLADSGAVWVPTIQPLAVLVERETDPGRRDRIQRIIEDQVGQLRLARELGAKVAAGTDGGSPGVRAGADLGRELGWFVKAGYSMVETLTRVTQTAAEPAGLGNDLGRLTPGKMAYMVGFAADEKPADTLADPPIFVGRPASSANDQL
jgi:imidazolonepropionase-like amidohydrolase